MSDSLTIASGEAQMLSRYLIGDSCSDSTAHHYEKAVKQMNATMNAGQQKTWNNMMASPFYLKLVDSGLATCDPQSALRKRIFIMLTLLEASPEHVRYFLPQERSIWYLVPLGWRAGLSALYLVAGTIAVKVMNVR